MYGDLYRLAFEKLEWTHVSSPNSPPPRSGHAAAAYRHHMIVFGAEGGEAGEGRGGEGCC